MPQDHLVELAVLIAEHNEAKKLMDEAREAFDAEFAEGLTREKQTYLNLERKKDLIRSQFEQRFRETGEKPDTVGIGLAMLDALQIDDERKAVEFCAKYAPELLQLRGKELLKEWASRHVALVRTGENQWAALYEVPGERNHLVPCPFRIVRHPSIRISEKEILSAEDERKWEEDHAGE